MERVMRDVGLVVAAGGGSSRFGGGRNKLLVPWRGKPLFCHGLDTLAPLLLPAHVVLVVPPALTDAFAAALNAAGQAATCRLVPGGATRVESVRNGLLTLPQTVSIVAIQDAARPLTTAALLAACIASARQCGSGVAARRLTDTVKEAGPDGTVARTLDRDRLWAAETPQVFRRDWLSAALSAALTASTPVTDDAQAVARLGHPVQLVENRQPNPKITYADDLWLLDGNPGDSGRVN